MSPRQIYLVVSLLLTTAVLLPFGLLVLLVRPLDPRGSVAFGYAKLWGWAFVVLNPWWRVRVEGKGHLTKGVGYVLVATHQNMLDIPLMYFLPGLHFKWVSKQEVYSWPVVGWVLWLQRSITIRRGEADSAKQMMAQGTMRLAQGISVAVFPEGTRSKTGRVGKFLPGAFLLAARAEAPVLPVVVAGDFEPKTGKRPMRAVFTMKILPPISPEELNDRGVKKTMQELEEKMRAEHKKLVPEWYVE